MTGANHPCILIVDDQPEIRHLLRLTFAAEPWVVVEAGDGETAWQLASSLRPALILLDIGLPGSLDGLAVCRRVRADAALAGTRVLLMTGQDSEALTERAAEAGAHGVLVKPIRPLALLERIDALLLPPAASAC